MDHAASILGLDIGSVRIGVSRALWPDGIPEPLVVLRNDESLLTNLQQLVNDQNAKYIVAGNPRSLGGQDTDQTRYTVELVNALQGRLQVKILFQDESATSLKAEEELKGRGRPYSKEDIDLLSAVYILEDFLNSHKNGKDLDE